MSRYLFADGSRRGHPAHGFIYAAQEEETPLVKIGYTSGSASDRLVALKSEYKCSFRLLASVETHDLVWIESAVHTLLASSRIWGEFFYLYMSQKDLEALVTQARAIIDSQLEAERAWIRVRECRRIERRRIAEEMSIAREEKARDILRLGRLAYSYGLHTCDEATLCRIFAAGARGLTEELS